MINREYNENKPSCREYLFRPYNITDIEHFTKSEKYSYKVDLNSWGNVSFLSGKIGNSNDRVIFPAAYLVNDQNDILYRFSAPYLTGTEISNVSIEDMNDDGLKDVKMTFRFIIATDVNDIEWIFYQMDNGLFYDCNLDIDKKFP